MIPSVWEVYYLTRNTYACNIWWFPCFFRQIGIEGMWHSWPLLLLSATTKLKKTQTDSRLQLTKFIAVKQSRFKNQLCSQRIKSQEAMQGHAYKALTTYNTKWVNKYQISREHAMEKSKEIPVTRMLKVQNKYRTYKLNWQTIAVYT